MMSKKVFVILMSTLLLTSVAVFPSTTAQTSSGVQTGDDFEYHTNETNDVFDDFYSNLYNSSSGDDFRVESRQNGFYEELSGYSFVQFVKGINPPNELFPPQIDTALLLEQDMVVDFGEFYFSEYINDTFDPSQNVNDSFTDSYTGENIYRDHTEYAGSNSTYSAIFPQMVLNSFHFEVPIPDEFLDSSGSEIGDVNLTLDYRTVVSGNDSYQINGGSHSLSTYTVSSMFSYNFSSNIEGTIPFGDIDLDLNGSTHIYSSMYQEVVYDQSNGVILEKYDDSSLNVDMNLENDSFTLPDSGINFGFFLSTSHSSHHSSYSVIDTASSFYGNSRPTSSGDNRLEESDTLTYDADGFSEFRYDFSVSNGETYSGSFAALTQWNGQATIDVYYHEPGYIKSVLTLDGEGTTDITSNPPDSPSDSFTENFYLYEVDIFETPTNDSYEIYPGIEDYKFIEFPWDNPRNNDGGEDFPEFVWNLPREIPLVKINQTSEIKNFTINGFEYMIETNSIEGFYEDTYTDSYFSEEFQAQINVEANYDASVELVYDNKTGVLLERTESVDVFITADIGSSQITTDQQGKIDIEFRNEIDLTLNSHPNEYQSEQTEFPEDPSDDTASNTSTTNTTAGPDTPALDLPIPAWSIGFSLIMIALVVKRRK